MAIRVAVLFASVFVALSATASAQVRHAQRTRGGDIYEFRDDPLAAQGMAATGWRITVVGGHPRVLLIRPRTSFVPEMLKSVEKH
jgi:hypothetical protein